MGANAPRERLSKMNGVVIIVLGWLPYLFGYNLLTSGRHALGICPLIVWMDMLCRISMVGSIRGMWHFRFMNLISSMLCTQYQI